MGRGRKKPNSGRKKSGAKCFKDDSLGTVIEGETERMARVRQQETSPRPREEQYPSLGLEAKRVAFGRHPTDTLVP